MEKSTTPKKHFFKKEKKTLEPKRHKAPSTHKEEKHKQKQEKHHPKLGFPKIPRFITEQKTWFVVLLVLAIGAIGFLGSTLYSQWQQVQHARQKQAKLTHDLRTWENIIQRYPTYEDAYFEAAIVAYQLGERAEEMRLLQQLQALNPNYSLAQSLEKIRR